MATATSPACAETQTTSATSPAADTNMPSPYQLKLQYIGEIWDDTQGGQATGPLYMQNLDAQLRVNTDEAFGWTGGKFLLEGYYGSSRSVSKQLVGNSALDSQSPIDNYGASRLSLYQLYYDQNIGSNHFLFGVWDPQSEFANTAQQNLFLNRNFAMTSTMNGPFKVQSSMA